MTSADVRILIVDDVKSNIDILVEGLKGEYKLSVALNGESALKSARSARPDLILLDVNMPGMSGYEVCEQIKSMPDLKDVPVIFVSALNEPLDKVKAFALGAVDYVTKPFFLEEVRARIETHVKVRRLQEEIERRNVFLRDLVQAQVREISDAQMATILALAKLAESRDGETGRHLERVQSLCRILAARLHERPRQRVLVDEGFVENIFHASPLHDIGKVGIPDSVLLKPSNLTGDEYEIMKTHTLIGARTLEAVSSRHGGNGFIRMGIAIARSHHERWDGAGYPDRLAQEDIPLPARIMAVADAYDAFRSRRPYKEPATHEQACDMIRVGSGTQFDPAVVEAFVRATDEIRVRHEDMREEGG